MRFRCCAREIQVKRLSQRFNNRRSLFSACSLKSWSCHRCGKRYMWRDSLKKHLRVECGKDPTFECPICGRKFKHKHRWQSHARLIHYLNIWLSYKPTDRSRGDWHAPNEYTRRQIFSLIFLSILTRHCTLEWDRNFHAVSDFYSELRNVRKAPSRNYWEDAIVIDNIYICSTRWYLYLFLYLKMYNNEDKRP